MTHIADFSDPHAVREADFPANGSSEEKLRFLLNYAVLAPSTRNTQPWLWEIEGNEVTLYADRSRILPALDPEGRQLIMSCGAALQHLRLAMRAFGYVGISSILPDPHQPNLLARVRLAGRREPGNIETLLFQAIPQRHTNRHLYEKREIPQALLDTLQNDAAQEGAWLHIVEDTNERAALIEMIAQGDVLLGHDTKARHDVARWIRPNYSTHEDGIPGHLLGLNNLTAYLTPFALRALDNGQAQADKDWMLAGSAPVLAVLGTDMEGPIDWLNTGQALARILLHAAAEGVSASFFNSPIEVPKLWPQLRHLLGRSGFPQLVFRLGYATEAQPTPRRPVDDVETTNKDN